METFLLVIETEEKKKICVGGNLQAQDQWKGIRQILLLPGLSVASASLPLNQYTRGAIQPKRGRRPLPTGVFTSLLTFLAVAVIPMIYYGMVIGWGVAVTQSGRSMNHVGQSISLRPVTAKRS